MISSPSNHSTNLNVGFGAGCLRCYLNAVLRWVRCCHTGMLLTLTTHSVKYLGAPGFLRPSQIAGEIEQMIALQQQEHAISGRSSGGWLRLMPNMTWCVWLTI